MGIDTKVKDIELFKEFEHVTKTCGYTIEQLHRTYLAMPYGHDEAVYEAKAELWKAARNDS